MSVTSTRCAQILTGHGGLEKLVFKTGLPIPEPGRGEVLIKVAACGCNNTDVWTREGAYAKGAEGGDDASGWQPLTFPLVQGADAVGTILKKGEGVKVALGERCVLFPKPSLARQNSVSLTRTAQHCLSVPLFCSSLVCSAS